jgi:hypothetical protein
MSSATESSATEYTVVAHLSSNTSRCSDLASDQNPVVGQSGSTGLTFRSIMLLTVDKGGRGKAKITWNHALGGLDANEELSRSCIS